MRERVIDVSHWDGAVDYPAWRERHGLWGVIVKAGGNESGLGRYVDPMFETHYNDAKAAGLHVGSYYYTVSTTIDDAIADARHFASLMSGRQFDLPVYMDVEDPAQFRLSQRALTNVIKAFCDELQRLGFKSGIYTGGNAWLNNMYHEELLQYADWIAWWRGEWPHEAGDVGMWQQGTMRLSDGAVYYDDVSGCTDMDWCAIDYPSKIVAAGLNGYDGEGRGDNRQVGGTLSYPDMIAEAAEHFANHDAHGYSQVNRFGNGTTEHLTFSDGTPWQTAGGDRDCSSDACDCAIAAGLVPPGTWMWTGNEYEILTENGFVCMDFDWYDARRGDILLVDGHTGVALGNGLQADARGDEYGGIDGPNEGDQTGHEIEVRDLQWYWTWTFRYMGPERSVPVPEVKPEQLPGEPVNDHGIWYRSHVQNAEWMEPVHDGQCAGTVGYSARVEAIKITPPEGVELEVIAHVQGIGNLWFEGIRKGEGSGLGTSDNDPIIGTVGESRRLEAIRVRVTKRPEGLGKLRVQAHVQGIGWLDPVGEDQWAGTRGQSLRLEAFRMWFD
ncbi:MAG: hypothetical protein IKF14_18455 [Atopobiaceae bacterium]|nr:hypothetical protein [Atopobiaceae bacterium]MBR3161072.1 hypothetical protein [Atopobiaceae bacterium]